MPTIELPNTWVTDEEKERLKSLFGVEADDELDSILGNIARAALAEYKEMLLGQGLPTRADEIKQHRLFHLIKNHFQGRMPSENEVSRYFQLTSSQSKYLIQSVRTRYKFELEAELAGTLSALLQQATYDEDEETYRVVIQSENILSELRAILDNLAPTLPPITKVRGTSRGYTIAPDSYRVLAGYLGIAI